MVFADREDAGHKLAQALKKYQDQHPIIFALPRGGVVLGAEIAQELQSPLDLLIIRKVGHPLQPEYAICAVSENGHLVCNRRELAEVNKEWFKQKVKDEIAEAERRHQVYLDGRKPAEVKDKIAIIVDDGIATGLTAEAAIEEIKQQKPQKIILAVPVIPKETAERLGCEVNEIIALDIPEEFLGSVGAYYARFPQISDQEVIDLLKKANHG
jgi:putative phosphoribosyl transferase